MWDAVVAEWLALLRECPDLMAILGTDGQFRVYPSQAAPRPIEIPSVEYTLISDVEPSLFNPITMQVDIFARATSAYTIERLLRSLTHRDTSRVLGGMRLWMRYLDSRTHGYPDKGVLHRSLDFHLEPLRALYANL
jgi:hypothetical protein